MLGGEPLAAAAQRPVAVYEFEYRQVILVLSRALTSLCARTLSVCGSDSGWERNTRVGGVACSHRWPAAVWTSAGKGWSFVAACSSKFHAKGHRLTHQSHASGYRPGNAREVPMRQISTRIRDEDSDNDSTSIRRGSSQISRNLVTFCW